MDSITAMILFTMFGCTGILAYAICLVRLDIVRLYEKLNELEKKKK